MHLYSNTYSEVKCLFLQLIASLYSDIIAFWYSS